MDVARARRLRTLTNPSVEKYCIFNFYPMYDDSYPIFNKKHLSRISKEAGKEIKGPNISLRINDYYFDIYVVKVE